MNNLHRRVVPNRKWSYLRKLRIAPLTQFINSILWGYNLSLFAVGPKYGQFWICVLRSAVCVCVCVCVCVQGHFLCIFFLKFLFIKTKSKHGLDVTAGLFLERQLNESEQRCNVVVRGCIIPSYHFLEIERERMIRQRGGKVRIVIS